MAKYKMIKMRDRIYDDFEGSLQSLIDNLQLYVEKYGKDAYVDYDYEGYDDVYKEYYINYARQETDAERNKRLVTARKERERKVAATAAKEEKERKELARLQKKYGK